MECEPMNLKIGNRAGFVYKVFTQLNRRAEIAQTRFDLAECVGVRGQSGE
jgi:hypothetical protein